MILNLKVFFFVLLWASQFQSNCCLSQDLATKTNQLSVIERLVANCKWKWEDSRVGPLLEGFSPTGKYGFKVESIIGEPAVNISVTNDKRGDVYSWKGNYLSVFLVEEDRLYFADWSLVGTGGEIVAVDLLSSKELWRKRLKALGPISHSGYANSIRIDFKNGMIWIWGNESLGNYVEVKNPEFGKTIAHKIFPTQLAD